MSEDHAELIEHVTRLLSRTVPDLIDDPRVPVHILRHTLRCSLLDILQPFILEHSAQHKDFELVCTNIVTDAVDAVIAGRERAC